MPALIHLEDKTYLIRYLLVGSGAFLVEYVSFYILYNSLSAKVVAANSLSFIAGLLFSFSFNRQWAFKKYEYNYQKNLSHQFSIYLGLAIFNLLASNVIVVVLQQLSVNPLLGKIVAIAFIAAWNFVLFRKIIFKIKD